MQTYVRPKSSSKSRCYKKSFNENILKKPAQNSVIQTRRVLNKLNFRCGTRSMSHRKQKHPKILSKFFLLTPFFMYHLNVNDFLLKSNFEHHDDKLWAEIRATVNPAWQLKSYNTMSKHCFCVVLGVI